MASIAKLAVILTAVSKPLEDGLKSAQSKVSSFSKGIAGGLGKGLGVGLGVMGLDNMESAIKSAMRDNEEMAASAEKIEKSFGQALINITGMKDWLPYVAKEMEAIANGDFWEDLKRRAHVGFWSLLGQGDQAQKEAVSMKVLHEAYKEAAKAQEELRIAEKQRIKEQNDWEIEQHTGTVEMFEYAKELRKQIESMDPNAEMKKLQRFRDENGASFGMEEIEALLETKEALKAEQAALDSVFDLYAEGAQLTKEMITPLEQLASKQAEYNDLLLEGAIDYETYRRAMEKITPGLNDIKAIQDEIYKLENGELAARIKALTEQGADQNMINMFSKEYQRLEDLKESLKTEEMPDFSKTGSDEPKFAGAVEAGSAAAYSALLNARAGMQGNSQEELDKRVAQNTSLSVTALNAILKEVHEANKNKAAVSIAVKSLQGGI